MKIDISFYIVKAKQMPGSTSKLRQLVKSKHPYVERNLGSVLNIIKNSMQNAAAFESSVQLLKEGGRMGTVNATFIN